MSNALVLIAPRLLALPAQDLAAMRSLATLGRYAGLPRREPRGIAQALFTALGIPAETPVAPLALLGCGGDPDGDYVLCADPVHLAADRDTVVLVQTIDDLSADEAATLVRMLDRHFADDGLRFDAMRPNAWFVRSREPADIETTPPDTARGRNLIAHLPRGRDAGRWKRWQNEIEMLLHGHPVNAAREAQGKLPANAFWFWGGGRAADLPPMPVTIVTAPQTRLGDLAHGIARCTNREAQRMNDDLDHAMARATSVAPGRPKPLMRPPGGSELLTQDASSTFVLAVTPPADADPAALDAAWLMPALALLESHRIGELQMIAGGSGAAATWTARPPAWWRRVAARASPRALRMPPPADA
jgi:hypothetical protein